MALKILHLISGEDIIADIEDKEPNSYSVKQPLRILQMGEASDSIGVMLFAPFVKGHTIPSINKEHIIFIADPEEELADHYRKQFGQIVLPKTSIIM